MYQEGRQANYEVVPGLRERVGFLQRQEIPGWQSGQLLEQMRFGLWQNWICQVLIAVLRLDDPRYLEAYAFAGADIQQCERPHHVA